MSSMRSWRSEWRIPPAKIDISQPDKSVLNTLFDLYSQYGCIVSIRSVSNFIATVGFGYVIIELTDGRYAEVAVVNDKINKRYRIVPDVPLFRNDSCLLSMSTNAFPPLNQKSPLSNTSLPISLDLRNPPDPESSLNIINKLNDKHFQEIFSYLSLPDFCSVSDVCTTFRKTAKSIFTKRFEYKILEVDDVVRFERLARNFGTLIESLSINCWLYPDISTELRKNAVLSIFLKYFSGPDCQLHTLILTRMNIDVRWHLLLVPIFGKLQSLRLDQSKIGELLCLCTELISLELCNNVGKFTSNDSQTIRGLDNLERLTLWETKEWHNILFRQLDFGKKIFVLKIQDSENDQNYQTICDIFLKFPRLKELNLASSLCFNTLPLQERNEIGNIFKRMTNLSTLSIINIDKRPTRVSPLRPFFEISAFLNMLVGANVPLQRLSLSQNITHMELNSIAHFDKIQSLTINGLVLAALPMMQMIEKLHQLTELQLLGQSDPAYWDKEDIKKIVKYSKKLCHLYFGDWRKELIIFENDFNDIVHLIMDRVPKYRLTIIIRSNKNMTLAVPVEKITTYSELLQIKMLPRLMDKF